MIKTLCLFFSLLLLSIAALADTLTLPLQKFAPSPSLELRCISSSQSVSIPIPERWDIHGASLKLHYMASNNMIASSSQLTVKLNGAPVSEFRLNTQSPDQVVDVTLPVERMKAGYNTVSFEAVQHYLATQCEQVCSPDLWTNIDLTDSTIQLDYSLKPLPLRLGAAAGLVLDPKQIPEASINLVLDSASQQMVTLAGIIASGIAKHFDYRKVKFSHSPDIKPGMDNVLIGTTPFSAGVLGRYGIALSGGHGGFVRINHLPKKGGGEDDRHALLVVYGDTPKAIKIAAETFTNMSMPYPGTDELHAYSFAIPDISMYGGRDVLSSDKVYDFKTLGMDSRSFRGFVDSASTLSFRLPPDFLIRQNQYAQLVLNLSYGSGLRQDSALTISVNGKLFRDIHLNNADGNYITNYKIDIPTYLFKPGTNAISFKPYLNTKHEVCDVTLTDGLFVTIFGNSTLFFPPMPHFVELPKLELFSLNGFPFTRWPDGFRTIVYLPKPDAASIDTAFDMIGMLTQKNGFPLLETQFTFSEPGNWQGEILVVGEASAIPKSIMERAPMQLQGIATIPYPVSRDWENETTISISQQKSGMGPGSGLVTEFESPYQKGRSVVLVTAENENDLATLGDALLQPDILSRMKGGVSLIRLDVPGYDLVSLSVGKKYTTGEKGNISVVYSFLYAHPYAFYGILILAFFSLGFVGYMLLSRYRRKRE